MKTAIASLGALTAACFGLPSLMQDPQMGPQPTEVRADAHNLYLITKQARADLREMRIAAGLHAHPAGPHIDPEGHHANDTPEQQARERGEKEGHEDGGGEGGHEGRREGGRERGHEGGREGGHEGGREGRGERGHEGGREGRGERGHEGGREGRGEHGGREGRGEGGEGHEGRERGEHGGREGRNREGKTQIRKNQKHDHRYRNGAHLTLQYNPATQAFVGHVKNTTKKVLKQVRVEIHLSNGRELGPTMRVDLKPGATVPVELSALDQEFKVWVTHPEAGTEAGHGPGGEESEGHAEREKGEHAAGMGDGRREGGGEHGGEGRGEGRGEHGGEGRGEGDKRAGASFRPLENQLLLLRGEMRAFKADLAAKKAKK